MSSQKCPACRQALPEGARACPHCAFVLDGDRGGAQPAAASNAAKAPSAAAEVIAEGQHSGTRAAAGDEPAAARPVSSGRDSARGPERVERIAEAGRARSPGVAANRVAERSQQSLPTAAREPSVAAELNAAASEPAVAPMAVGGAAWPRAQASQPFAQTQEHGPVADQAAQVPTPGSDMAPAPQESGARPAPARRRLTQKEIAIVIAAAAVMGWIIVNAIAAAFGIG